MKYYTVAIVFPDGVPQGDVKQAVKQQGPAVLAARVFVEVFGLRPVFIIKLFEYISKKTEKNYYLN